MIFKPRWSVNWPIRPDGIYTAIVRAIDPTDAVRVAAERELRTAEGYSLAFDYEPEVWRLRHPYQRRSRHVAGPFFPDTVPGEVAFAPLPVDLCEVADQVVSAVKARDALGYSKGEIRAVVGQIVTGLTPVEVEAVLARAATETGEINRLGHGTAGA